ncbi:MAG TPA: UDP-N-acetylglucosamine 2-epimerase (non-hydrolyzing) [Methanothrix sp.]|nr:UDP-N-acetylglucosamine 2-epimerase (non-hydrolyzing) [Methanothrix sp.]HPJ83234.1 UDP-N-acetylglucosamine 2-epimerase (non-hydrolyzing) [Methanothrix sp.]
MKVACVVGVRPEFIQAEPVIKELKKHDVILVHTGQHYDYEMSKIFFDELSIPEPDYHLGVGSGYHGHQTADILKNFEDVLLKEEPDCVLVFGDTNSTLSGALASVKLRIPLAHVEAGLRSFDRRMPEEINRVIVDHISNILFSPTEIAIANLKMEGVLNCVYNTGDVMYDSLIQKIDSVRNNRDILNEFGLESRKYFLVTLHRSENTENIHSLKNVLHAIDESDKQIIFPIHPRTEKLIKDSSVFSILNKNSAIRMIKPLGYLNFLKILQGASKVLTDSGGVQKQAFMLGIPCITLRESTEWVETVESGWNVLVGTDKDRIKRTINSFNPFGERPKLYGEGDASKKISQILNSLEGI